MNYLQRLQQLSGRFDKLSLRERLMVLVLLIATAGGVWFNLLWQPMLTSQTTIEQGISQNRDQIQLLTVQLNGLIKRAEDDPNKQIRLELEQIKQLIARMEGEIKGTTDALISPREMARLLEQMLLTQNGIRMISLNTLKTESLMTPEKTSGGAKEQNAVGTDRMADAASQNIYRHGFAIQFEGDYASILGYLKSLEQLPSQFFWDGIQLETVDYPVIRVKLRLHTLSLSEGWIGV